ncbi:aminotransferase class V-fold PLP-dependent enzyme [Ferrimonas balearica]|uniref:aminotransferase class V-fold PLP-dependent enzyme n=1 Tax=Ferrimonas balearica TaxID=44012 RepID=UPI001C99C131|nr:aminotransferase class V-fold PLP-dependent enzyme [Ferrimonas balearica]MBY5923382.1 aminotransferase class V-fold PLP-dependent enzyme [Ferrimonas balearica]MBY5995132.1 aminotransferase class V-fold PLP-dependent enzyme [Ferrimonas balearica]
MSSHNEPQLGRRRFLKTTTGLAVAMALPTQALAADDLVHLERHGNAPDERFWRKVQKEFVLAKRTTYMNIGTTGSMPRVVLDGFDTNNTIVARDPWAMEGKFGGFANVGNMIDAIAPGFGADSHEIVLSRNTTDGICSIIGGLQFESGDVVLTTHHEHVGLTSPLYVASQRYGVEVVELEIPVDTGDNSVTEEDYIRVFADAVALYGSRVRLIAFSHITYKTGTVLPAKRICKEVAVANGIPSLVDGAHGIGMLDLNFHDMDCDFYAGPGHKWQCGPGATGILYVRDEAKRLKEFWWDRSEPLHLINSSLAPAAMGICQRMQYIGNDHFPAKQALTDSCLMWDTIGRDRIETRVRELGSRCKRKLAQAFPNVKIYSPDVEGLNCGLTSVNPFDDQTDGELLLAFRDRLREEYGYIIRTTDFRLRKDDVVPTYALRISTHLFHSEQDVDGLVSAMRKLYREMA